MESKKEEVKTNHYRQGTLECIDAMIGVFGVEETAIFCKLNAFKYNCRLGYKDSEEKDATKMADYANMYKELKGFGNVENWKMERDNREDTQWHTMDITPELGRLCFVRLESIALGEDFVCAVSNKDGFSYSPLTKTEEWNPTHWMYIPKYKL